MCIPLVECISGWESQFLPHKIMDLKDIKISYELGTLLWLRDQFLHLPIALGLPKMTHLSVYTPTLTTLQDASTIILIMLMLIMLMLIMLISGTKSLEKLMSLFGGNTGISLKSSSKSLKTRWY